ncbi:hypothetical protein L2D97_25825, partial [Salmonella enterica subsp. enterica serovar Weltevreden]|uniref:hypothetical protein n=1 Tax=Salmonella enterica TaxID=28901 RepID=UPI001F30688F
VRRLVNMVALAAVEAQTTPLYSRITLSSGAGSPALFLCAAGIRHGMKGSGVDILEPIALPLLISLNMYYAQIE